MVLNTSFNENEPVGCTPEEALDCLLRTSMECLSWATLWYRASAGRSSWFSTFSGWVAGPGKGRRDGAPQSRGSARQWIDSHPDEPVPIGVLLLVGRLEEADDAIAALGMVPPDARSTSSCSVRPGASTAAIRHGPSVLGGLWRAAATAA